MKPQFFLLIYLVFQVTMGRAQDLMEVFPPSTPIQGILVLFPGYGENPDDILKEFQIFNPAQEEGILLVLMQVNQKLWLEEDGKKAIKEALGAIWKNSSINPSWFGIGGFSSGGNLAFQVGEYLAQYPLPMKVSHLFAIDSPLDLEGLYLAARTNIQSSVEPQLLQESQFLFRLLEGQLGNPRENLKAYERKSVFINSSENLDHLYSLRSVKMRLYTEPDKDWWKETKGVRHEYLNYIYLKKLYKQLVQGQFQVQLIESQSKGSRSNGERHPHSWSIVEISSLIEWLKKE